MYIYRTALRQEWSFATAERQEAAAYRSREDDTSVIVVVLLSRVVVVTRERILTLEWRYRVTTDLFGANNNFFFLLFFFFFLSFNNRHESSIRRRSSRSRAKSDQYLAFSSVKNGFSASIVAIHSFYVHLVFPREKERKQREIGCFTLTRLARRLAYLRNKNGYATQERNTEQEIEWEKESER